jgi:hypothetical protein
MQDQSKNEHDDFILVRTSVRIKTLRLVSMYYDVVKVHLGPRVSFGGLMTNN